MSGNRCAACAACAAAGIISDMGSPFPGMDPYLERHWLDVHTALVAGTRDSLNQGLPDDLIASAEERVAVETDEGKHRLIGPDVRVFEPPAGGVAVVEPATGTSVGLRYRLLAQSEPITERFIRVIEAGTERLVTVIEFVSPTNKGGDGLQAFRAKRGELLASGVNFVEIDLVRDGDWRALLRPFLCPRKAVTPYRMTVRLPNEPEAVYLEPITLRQRLPDLIVPLRRDDPQVRLELQPLVERAYANGRYDRRLTYAGPPDPPLDAEDAAWADELLRAAGRRS